MRRSRSKRNKLYAVAATLVVLITVVGVALYIRLAQDQEPVPVAVTEQVEVEEPAYKERRVIGTSVEGREIEAYTFGNGDVHLLFVGGIHGGYEWNSVLLAYALIDHLDADPTSVPSDLAVTVVPSANPDGVYEVIQKEGRFTLIDVPFDETANGHGRFNAHDVDLNRNFACKWQPESTWRNNVVSAGTGPFSEPEAQAVRDLVFEIEPVAAVFFHSQSNAVYASECTEGILLETRDVMNIYAGASGYNAVDSFDAYEITGDAEGWLASIDIPAITVELATHESVEWERNLRGFNALIAHYSSAL